MDRGGLWLPGGPVPRASIRYARVNHILSCDGGYPEEVFIRRAGGRDVTIGLPGRPNRLFLPALFAAIAAAQGIKVTGHRVSQ